MSDREERDQRTRRWAAAYLGGETMRAIAVADGLSSSRVGEQLRWLVRRAARLASPSAELPVGVRRVTLATGTTALRWNTTTRPIVAWALTLLDEHDRQAPLACPTCGRPL